jgi:hypothetical protein
MGNLIRVPFSEVSATIEKLDALGIIDDIFKRIRSDDVYARQLAKHILYGVPSYKIHRIDTKSPDDSEGRSVYRDAANTPNTIVWDPSLVEIVSGYENQTNKGGNFLSNIEGYCRLTKNVMWYLLHHQDLIPMEWFSVKEPIFFMGTIELDTIQNEEKVWGLKSKGSLWEIANDNFKHPKFPGRKELIYKII